QRRSHQQRANQRSSESLRLHDNLPSSGGLEADARSPLRLDFARFQIERRRDHDDAPAFIRAQRLNTYSIEAVDVCFSSGAFCRMNRDCLEPTSTAMYCLPLTE